MKIRVTIMTENNVPVSTLGDNPLTKIKGAWECVVAVINECSNSENGDKAELEKVEIVDEGENKA